MSRPVYGLRRRHVLPTMVVLVTVFSSAQVRTDAEIRGRIVAAENGAALPRARVSVLNAGVPVEPVFTDDRGRFVVAVPPARAMALRVYVRKAGFATRILDLPRAGAASANEIEIPLARGAAIRGRVVTSEGALVPSAPVLLRRLGDAGRDIEMLPVAVRTDDRGEYRVGGLEQGQYAVQLVDDLPVVGSDRAFTFAPGLGAVAAEDRLVALNRDLLAKPYDLPATFGDAMAIAIRPGDEANAPDLVMDRPDLFGSCRTARDGPADPSATASLTGRVLDPYGRPIPCAAVTLHGASGPNLTVSTNPGGRYVHTRLSAGTYTVQAVRQGYATRRHGRDAANPRGRGITIRRGESIGGIDVILPPRPAVTGRVLNDLGEPVSGVSVRAFEIRETGDLTLAVYAPGIGVRSTDDTGRYRLFGFPPGRYLIGASFEAAVAGPDGVYGYMPIFFPATPDVAGASPLDLGEEGDVTGVDLTMVRSRARRITGTAVDGAGRPAREVIVFPSVRSTQMLLEPRSVPVGPGGSFSIPNVAPGEYVVQAAGSAERSDGYGILPRDFGMVYVTVGDADPAPVSVRAVQGAVVEGRMFARGGEAQLRQLLFENDVWLWPLPADPDRSWAGREPRRGFALLEGGRFRVSGVTGVRRFVVERVPDEWYVESVTVNGRDALNAPFDFGSGPARFSGVQAVLSDEAAVVTSRIVDARGAQVAGASTLVFSTDRSLWFRESQHLSVGRPGRDGVIRVGSLPPGEYFVAGYDPPDPVSFRFAGWLDTALLERLASAAERITLAPRERRDLVLRVER